MSTRFLIACLSVAAALGIALPSARGREDDATSVAQFKKTVAPIVEKFCLSCHSGQEGKGGIDFDREDVAALVKDKTVWLKALKMIQAEMMPPKGKRAAGQDEAQPGHRRASGGGVGFPQSQHAGADEVTETAAEGRRMDRQGQPGRFRDVVG